MKIEITNFVLEEPFDEKEWYEEFVNGELESNKWHIGMYDNFPEFVSDTNDYWEITWDKYNLAWRLTYDGEYVGQVRFEDDIDILWNR